MPGPYSQKDRKGYAFVLTMCIENERIDCFFNVIEKFGFPDGNIARDAREGGLMNSQISFDAVVKRRRLNEDNDDFPSVELLPQDLHWSTHGRRLKLIVDCKPLFDILSRDAVYDCKLDGGSARAILAKMAAHFDALLSMDWRLQHSTDNFIHWSKREHNKLADHLCNRTMDEARYWKWQITDLMATLAATRNSKLLGFSDGGLREKLGAAAAAWL